MWGNFIKKNWKRKRKRKKKMLDLIDKNLFGLENWYLCIAIYTVIFQIWFYLTKEVAINKKLSPTYYCSLLHITLVIFPNLNMIWDALKQSYLISTNDRAIHTIFLSISYFIIDSVRRKKKKLFNSPFFSYKIIL